MCHSFDFYSFVGDFRLNSMHCIWQLPLSHMVITQHKHKFKPITRPLPYPFKNVASKHNPASDYITICCYILDVYKHNFVVTGLKCFRLTHI